MNDKNRNLQRAKKVKNDEFYTRYVDIQQEIEAYIEYDKDVFRGKVVYCNCDDPYESNFFRYFVLNFNRIGLKRLITTSFKPSPVANTQMMLFGDDETLPQTKGRPKVNANRFIINEVRDENADGELNLEDIALQLRRNRSNDWMPLEGEGDFRSPECVELLKQADIVVTNPPFSLFREYIKQVFDYQKKFLIIGNMNAITYKDIFPKIKDNEMWLGNRSANIDMLFHVPDRFAKELVETRKEGSAYRMLDGVVMGRLANAVWFTNLDHGRRHQPLPLMTMADNLKFSKRKEIRGKAGYDRYDNYDAIEVPFTEAIPSDYEGVMGVPISFLDKYCPEQFEIVGATESEGKGFSEGLWDETSGVAQPMVGGARIYKRIFLRHKKTQ